MSTFEELKAMFARNQRMTSWSAKHCVHLQLMTRKLDEVIQYPSGLYIKGFKDQFRVY